MWRSVSCFSPCADCLQCILLISRQLPLKPDTKMLPSLRKCFEPWPSPECRLCWKAILETKKRLDTWTTLWRWRGILIFCLRINFLELCCISRAEGFFSGIRLEWFLWLRNASIAPNVYFRSYWKFTFVSGPKKTNFSRRALKGWSWELLLRSSPKKCEKFFVDFDW